jgi:hypothetical protein
MHGYQYSTLFSLCAASDFRCLSSIHLRSIRNQSVTLRIWCSCPTQAAGAEVLLALLVRISHAAKAIGDNPPVKSVKIEMKRKQGCPVCLRGSGTWW